MCGGVRAGIGEAGVLLGRWSKTYHAKRCDPATLKGSDSEKGQGNWAQVTFIETVCALSVGGMKELHCKSRALISNRTYVRSVKRYG